MRAQQRAIRACVRACAARRAGLSRLLVECNGRVDPGFDGQF